MNLFILASAALASTAIAKSGLQAKHDKVLGCYFGAWSVYRPGYGKYDVDDIDPSLCTHGYYGFAKMDNVSWVLAAYDPWYDLGESDCEPFKCKYDSYRRFVNLTRKNPDFVPILSVGGWSAGSGDFSVMAGDPDKKRTFLDSILPFIKKFGFKGLDFDWEYPGNREGADPAHDKENFNILVEELGELLHNEGLLFTAALSPGKKTIDVAYDMPRIAKQLDLLNVMTYDYHGWWENHNFTGVNAPFRTRKIEDYEGHPGYYFSVVKTLEYYIQLGAPKRKLVLGVPFYGRGFALEKKDDGNYDTGLYCPAHNGIPAGPYTRQDGFWGYLEILQAFTNKTLNDNLPGATPQNWTKVRDDCYQALYAYNGPYWIGYDDEQSIEVKTKYANFLGIAGVFTWSIDTDDHGAHVSSNTYPLLKAINRALASGETVDPYNPKCKGTAPMCDLFNNGCEEDGEVLPHPFDCHQYYMCRQLPSGLFNVIYFNCGDFAFDPNISSCVDPSLPGNELLCGEQEN